MSSDIRKVKDMNGLISYFSNKLEWRIDIDDFDDIDEIAYDFSAEDIGLKEDSFAKIKSLCQLPPLVDGQRWGIFCVEFDSKRFEVTALRKILSGLIPTRRNSAEHAVWDKKDLLFLCFWGLENERTIGIAHFQDKDNGLPQIKMISCAPSVEDFTQIQVFEKRLEQLKWPNNYLDHEKWARDWSEAFVTGYRQTIRDAATLTSQLAKEAQNIRNRIMDTLAVESSNGYVHLLFEKFKNTLIHDMKETEFADMYAQTVVYGLFSARCMDNSQEDFSADEAIDCIPLTNPFLKSLMKECLGSRNDSKLSFDELEIDNVVELLKHTKTALIIQDFNRQTGGGKEDPVIHFYEDFLTEYDKTQRVKRGVYYTPQPVVDFIVKSVHQIIKKDFGQNEGLASTETKKIDIQRLSKKRINGLLRTVTVKKEVPAIQILDPATGTGTFIRQVILLIYQEFKDKYRHLNENEIDLKWNGYVNAHLLPRLNAFELMMAPYAVAHMKLAMVLKDTGYQFDSSQRLNVFLTNSLEQPGTTSGQLSLWTDPLASESIEANKAKKNEGINVIIGNPPYAGASINKGEWIQSLMEDYKREPGGIDKLKEKNPKWLNDDYVKFIRLSEEYISQCKQGIVGFICPHGFINNPTFRGMRWHLLQTFQTIYIINLHGNSNRKEKCPDGSKDENVFDIQQGVCVAIFVKSSDIGDSDSCIYYADVWGRRQYKYDYLNNTQIEDIHFEKVLPEGPEYNFNPVDINLKRKYEAGFSVDDLFETFSVGVVTAKDKVLINSSKSQLLKQVESYYHIKPNETMIRPIYYRPLDKQYIYYDPTLLERSRESVMKSFFYENIGLITARSNKGEDCTQFLVTDIMSEAKCGERTTQSAVFPLYIYCDQMGTIEKKVNLNPELLKTVSLHLGKSFSDMSDELHYAYEDLLAYIYGVLYLTGYRTKYKQFINLSYPKIPFPNDVIVFDRVAGYGRRLMEIHLMKGMAEELEDTVDSLLLQSISYQNDKVIINGEYVLAEIDESVWNYTMCGYRPLQKWLKDRRGRMLQKQDWSHFKNMIICVQETIKIVKEMDDDMIANSLIP